MACVACWPVCQMDCASALNPHTPGPSSLSTHFPAAHPNPCRPARSTATAAQASATAAPERRSSAGQLSGPAPAAALLPPLPPLLQGSSATAACRAAAQTSAARSLRGSRRRPGAWVAAPLLSAWQTCHCCRPTLSRLRIMSMTAAAWRRGWLRARRQQAVGQC